MARICNTLRQHGWPDSHKSFAKIAKRECHFRHGIPFGKWTKFQVCMHGPYKQVVPGTSLHVQTTFVKQSYSAPVPLFNSIVNARKYRDDLRYDYLSMMQTSLAQPRVAIAKIFQRDIRANRKLINGIIYLCVGKL